MNENRDQQFVVSSMGTLYRTSLEMFAHHLESVDGRNVLLEDLAINQPFFVVYKSGTGLTRTSAVRIA